MTVHPSGQQHEIVSGDTRATIVQVGGGLRSLRYGDLEVLDGYALDQMCRDGRGQLLIPWPNRIAGGAYEFDGQKYQLPLTEPSLGNANHGLVRWQQWAAAASSSVSVTMAHRLYPSPGYPFTLDLTARYLLHGSGLTVSLHAVNAGTEPCPFGAGQHPYLSCGTASVNDAVLQVPARTIHRYDEKLIPMERIPVAGTPLDFQSARAVGDTRINMDYTDFERDADGLARVTLRAPDGGVTVEVWMDRAFKHATLYTGETVNPPSRRRQSLAIEPMTCPPNAFVSGQDLIVLQPGESWDGTWGITVRT
jgi:aldose 1-epimerase